MLNLDSLQQSTHYLCCIFTIGLYVHVCMTSPAPTFITYLELSLTLIEILRIMFYI